MILSRWCCDTCFVQCWLQQGLTLDVCVRCGQPWRHVRDDHFDSVCACKITERKQAAAAKTWREDRCQLTFADSLGPMPERKGQTGLGAERPKVRSADGQDGAHAAGTISQAKGSRKGPQAGDETVPQLRLWNNRTPSKKGEAKAKVTPTREARGGTNSRKVYCLVIQSRVSGRAKRVA
jgi:hypothetical protein